MKIKIKKKLDSLVVKDYNKYEHFYPRGDWTNMNSINFDDISLPSKILNESLPEGGTLLEIMCGACDYVYEISKLNSWEIHATDIIASKFNTVNRSKENNINLYDIPIQVLLETNFKQKIDVFISHNSWGPKDKHWVENDPSLIVQNMNKTIENWVWANFYYILTQDKNIISKYKNNKKAFNEGECQIQLINSKTIQLEEWCLFKIN